MTDYTETERLALEVSRIVASGMAVIAATQQGQQHPLAVFRNEYGRVIPIGKQQSKVLAGMVVTSEVMQALTDAFVAFRESAAGQEMRVKVEANNAELAVEN